MNAHSDQVATAAGKELKVEEAATLIAANPQIPPRPTSSAQLAERWVDYTLLATALAEDSTLAVLDLDKLTAGPARAGDLDRLLQQASTSTPPTPTPSWSRRGRRRGPGWRCTPATSCSSPRARTPTPAQRDS